MRDLFLGLAFVPTMTEKGVTLTNADDSITWTGCHRHGDRIGFTPEGYCNNWTSSASGTVFGNPTGSYRWLRAFDNQTTKPCSSTGAAGLRLYCLEQPGQTVFPTPTATATLTPTVTPTPSNTSIPGYRLFVTNDTVMGSMQRPGSWNAPTGVAAITAQSPPTRKANLQTVSYTLLVKPKQTHLD